MLFFPSELFFLTEFQEELENKFVTNMLKILSVQNEPFNLEWILLNLYHFLVNLDFYSVHLLLLQCFSNIANVLWCCSTTPPNPVRPNIHPSRYILSKRGAVSFTSPSTKRKIKFKLTCILHIFDMNLCTWNTPLDTQAKSTTNHRFYFIVFQY